MVKSDNSDKKRHYTISNCMRPKVYRDYIKVMKAFLHGDYGKAQLAHESVSEDQTDEVCITLKDYDVKTGVATRIARQSLSETKFTIMGPLGKGLNVKSSGVHIAFSGGTGVLVYIDLVAYLIRENLG